MNEKVWQTFSALKHILIGIYKVTKSLADIR